MPPSLIETEAACDVATYFDTKAESAAAVFVRKRKRYLTPPSLLETKVVSYAAVFVRDESGI